MSKYLIQDTTLTSIADEVRALSGTEETLSPEAMKEKVAEGNENIAAEADLIAQIQAALEGKSGGISAIWESLDSLPVSYDIEEEDGNSVSRYLKLPSKECWVLFSRGGSECFIYNASGNTTFGNTIIEITFNIIEESNTFYLQIDTNYPSIYYMIISFKEV